MEGDKQPVSTRSAPYTTCPPFVVGGLPPSFRPVERSLVNLGENRHGRIERWSDGSASLTFYAGYDVFDELEDVDFSERRLSTQARSYLLHETKSDPQLLAVSWEEQGAPGPCAQIAIVGRGLSEERMVQAADGTLVDTG